MTTNRKHGMGWRPDLPDHRDRILATSPRAIRGLPPSADLREYDTPILDQGATSSCTAHAGVAIFEWLQKFRTGSYTPMSRLFLYWYSRKLAGVVGDEGSTLRATAKAMGKYGICHEDVEPFESKFINTAPPIVAIDNAEKHQATNYYKIPTSTRPQETLMNIKNALQTLPVMFGFTCYGSIFDVKEGGAIPMPTADEAPVGGHAIAAVGYDDNKQALLIKNSWGERWGDKGYGWLPYGYVLDGLADDFWVVADEEELVMLFRPEVR